LAADELFKLGNAGLVLADLRIFLEQRVQSYDDGCLPLTQKLGLEVMLATEFRLAGGAAQQIEDNLGFELGGE